MPRFARTWRGEVTRRRARGVHGRERFLPELFGRKCFPRGGVPARQIGMATASWLRFFGGVTTSVIPDRWQRGEGQEARAFRLERGSDIPSAHRCSVHETVTWKWPLGRWRREFRFQCEVPCRHPRGGPPGIGRAGPSSDVPRSSACSSVGLVRRRSGAWWPGAVTPVGAKLVP